MKMWLCAATASAVLAGAAPAGAATLVASGFGTDFDLGLFSPNATGERYRLMLVSDAPVAVAALERQFYVVHYNWSDDEQSWYKDYVQYLTEPLFWDPRILTTYKTTPTGVTISADAPLPLEMNALPGEDYDDYQGYAFTQLFAWTDKPAAWKIYATPMPQPATWALMMLGLGMAGLGLRSRRSTASHLPL